MMSTLPACDKKTFERFQAITGDKYSVVNMLNELLETPLEINIEPECLAMTSSWSSDDLSFDNKEGHVLVTRVYFV